MPPGPHGPEHPRDPNRVKLALRNWRSADQFLMHAGLRDPQDRYRLSYEQAIFQVAAALASVPTLEALVEHYDAPPYRRKGQRDLVEEVCEVAASCGVHLLPYIVKDAAYYRRARQLLTTWWTQDWQPPQPDPPPASSPTAPEGPPLAQPRDDLQPTPRKRTRRKPTVPPGNR